MVVTKKELMDIELKDGELLEVSKKKVQREPMPPWNMVGNGMSNRVGVSMDFIDICAELNQAELKLFKFFRDMYNNNVRYKENETNIVVPSRSEWYTPYLAKALEKNYKHMEYVGIITRVKRGVYLINPNLLIPISGYGVAMALWNKLTAKEVVDE